MVAHQRAGGRLRLVEGGCGAVQGRLARPRRRPERQNEKHFEDNI